MRDDIYLNLEVNMSKTEQPRMLLHFNRCKDPRTRPVRYPLLEIILVVFLATLCGEEGWEAVVEWGKDKLGFLRKFLPFENGIACPDTFRRVTERVNPKEFLESFFAWVGEYKERVSGQICIDGKTLRHAMRKDGHPLHLVSAWCEANQLILGAVRTAAKSNEIAAIKELLDTLVLTKGDIITIDAIGCQLDIAAKIYDNGADYLLAVKQNQPNLADEIANFFDQATQAVEYAPVIVHRHQKDGHGRDDYQETWVTEDIEWLPQRLEWAGLSSLIMVYRKWLENGENHEEKRYYICSCKTNPEHLAHLIKRHWSIENEFHWHLDVSFGEDNSNVGATANENLRIARMTALELLKSEKSFSKEIKAKSRRCVRSNDYLEKVLLAGNF